MATPTPVEEWTLDNDIDPNGTGRTFMIQAVTRPVGKGHVYIDFENLENDQYVSQNLTPEQARALATMLLYAAEKVDPSGD